MNDERHEANINEARLYVDISSLFLKNEFSRNTILSYLDLALNML